MANPLIDQGTLNRLRGSVVFPDFPALQVTAPYLARAGIRLSLNGAITQRIPTMTGTVTSPEPYVPVVLSIALLRTQPLADQFKAQMELLSLIGAATVRPDSSILSPYELVNCSIDGVGEQSFAGEDPAFVVTIGAYYSVNSSLFD